MKINVRVNEFTDRFEVVEHVINDVTYTGIRIYLDIPTVANVTQSEKVTDIELKTTEENSVTFWDTTGLQEVQNQATRLLDFAIKHKIKRRHHDSNKS